MSQETFSLLHPGVQEAVWKMGWKNFKPIQIQAIHVVCESSKHLIICAPTAGGKTEAAFLPIISKIAADPLPSVQAIYVGPLKALINDQFQRLEELCTTLEIPVHRWHGDVPAGQKKALRDKPCGILLITPESLESNFINFGVQIPKVYQHLSFVVVDELHSFFANERGVHLQSLLSRLQYASGCIPRIIGLSATLANLDSAKKFVAADAPENVHIIEDISARREIKFGLKTFLESSPQRDMQDLRLTADESLTLASNLTARTIDDKKEFENLLPKRITQPAAAPTQSLGALDEIADDIIENFRFSTNLIFSNAKADLEEMADKLHERVRHQKWARDPFVVHHGSLSKDLREDAEIALKSGVPTTALCSSTLEMGIDIGHVRAIGQVGVPWTVSSMVQRLGRSGRREGESSIMRMYVREESPHSRSNLSDLLFPELVRAIAMIRLMLKKWLESSEQNKMHVSTLTHQILSCLKQTGGMPAAAIYSLLCQRGPFRCFDKQQFQMLLRSLAKNGLIEQVPRTGELILAISGERITSNFDFYAAFQTRQEFVIRAGSEEIGKLPIDTIPPLGEHLLLAGRRWRVKEINYNQKMVMVSLSPGKKTAIFVSSSGEILTPVFQEMKAVLMDNDQPAYLDHNSKQLLMAARKTALTAGLNVRDVVIGRQKIQWFPWVGTRAFETLLLLAKYSKIPCERDRHRISLTYQFSSSGDFFQYLKKVSVSRIDPVSLASLIPNKAIEKFDEFATEQLLNEANATSRLDLQGALVAINEILALSGMPISESSSA